MVYKAADALNDVRESISDPGVDIVLAKSEQDANPQRQSIQSLVEEEQRKNKAYNTVNHRADRSDIVFILQQQNT